MTLPPDTISEPRALSVSCVAKDCAVLCAFQCSYIIQAYKKDNPLMV